MSPLIFPEDVARVIAREQRLARMWICRMSVVSALSGIILGLLLGIQLR